MEIHEIRYFLAVAEHKNFTRAAEHCGVSQPAITRAIRKLETELGGILFDRRAGRAALTELGRKLMPRLEKAYHEVGKAKETAYALTDARKHMLRLGVMCTIGPAQVSALLEKLKAKVPDLVITLKDGKSAEIIDLLLADEIDAGLSAWPRYPEEIAPLPLFRERFVVAFATGHIFGTLSSVPLEQLSGESYLERLSCEFDEYFKEGFGDWTIDTDVRFSSEREDWIQAMIKSGVGCSIVPEYSPLLDGIETRPLSEPEVVRQVSILTARGRVFSPVTEAFVRLASAHKWQKRAYA